MGDHNHTLSVYIHLPSDPSDPEKKAEGMLYPRAQPNRSVHFRVDIEVEDHGRKKLDLTVQHGFGEGEFDPDDFELTTGKSLRSYLREHIVEREGLDVVSPHKTEHFRLDFGRIHSGTPLKFEFYE